MKRQRIYLLLFPALLLASGCSDSEQSEPEQIPIELHAQGNATVETKADQTITEAFGTTVFASMRSGDYTGLTSPAMEQRSAVRQQHLSRVPCFYRRLPALPMLIS